MKLNLRWGHPTFLAPYWDFTPVLVDPLKKEKNYIFGGTETLKERIKDLHILVKNAKVDDKHVVVGAGATQILLGLFTILKKNPELFSGITDLKKNPELFSEITANCSIWAKPPYYSRFKPLAELAGLSWKDNKAHTRISAAPNNPDGKIPRYTKRDIILDLCYMWPQYTNNVKKIDHPIMVFSLGKATGHASTRIGWAVIKNKLLAEKLEQYIEVAGNGVSIDAQIRAERVIETQLKTDFTVFEDGKTTLTNRWSILLENKHLLPFKLLNSSGMFIWAQGKCPEEILCLSGEELGDSDDKFRLNLGCSDQDFATLLKILRV